MSQEYYTVLARTIATAGQNPAHLRALVYRLARAELKRELFKNGNSISLFEAKQQISALDAAIEQIEATLKGETLVASENANEQKTIAGPNATAVVEHSSARLPVRTPYRAEVLPPLGSAPRFLTQHNWKIAPTGQADPFIYPPEPGRIRAAFRLSVQVVLAAFLAAAIVAFHERGSLFSSRMPHARSTVVEPQVKQRPSLPGLQPAGIPLPSFYGVYAVSGGHLTGLGTLPIRVPDPRVEISALISTPSAATLPDGRLEFVAFRSDLADDAPDRATVRVVARVMHELTFDSAGRAKTVDVKGSWAVRGDSYEMRVGPVSGHAGMVLIRPAEPGFIFPAGRYALVLKNTAYDFTVAGPVTDPAQCLERTDAIDEPVYNECRKP